MDDQEKGLECRSRLRQEVGKLQRLCGVQMVLGVLVELTEELLRGELCPTCRGQGLAVDPEGWVGGKCARCGGSGFRPVQA